MGIFSKITKKQNITLPPAEDKKGAVKPTAPAGDKAAKPFVRGPLAKEGSGRSYSILVAPLLTEKADRQKALGQYVFIVDRAANKQAVAEAVRDLYGVKPVSVRIVNVKGKRVRFGRTAGKQKDVKKAIVTLKDGESISAVEG